MQMPEMWMDGNGVELKLTAPAGELYVMPLALVVLTGQISDGEIVRFTYDRANPETGEVTHGAARLVLEDLPDPRDRKTEEQPPAADATVPTPHINCKRLAQPHPPHVWNAAWHAFHCDGESAYDAGKYATPTRDSGAIPPGGFPLLPPYTPPAW